MVLELTLFLSDEVSRTHVMFIRSGVLLTVNPDISKFKINLSSLIVRYSLSSFYGGRMNGKDSFPFRRYTRLDDFIIGI